VVEEICALAEADGRLSGVNPAMVSCWEMGKKKPSPFYQERLCKIYGMSAEALGLLDPSVSSLANQLSQLQTGSTWYNARAYFPLIASVAVTEERAQPLLPRQVEPENQEARELEALHPSTVTVNPADSMIHPQSLLARVMMLVYLRQYQTASCDILQKAIDQEIEERIPLKHPNTNDDTQLSRRDALVILAGLPLSLLLKSPQEPTAPLFAEEFLPQCAASITACWHLMRGNQLAVVDEVLSAYLPMLTTLATYPSRYQKPAAYLATQGYRINGILALHRNNLKEREVYCQQAVQYSEIAEDSSLLVSALISLASTFYYNKHPIMAAQIYQRALTYLHHISPLLLARVYIELAVVCAQQKQQQEALRYMRLAQEMYPEYPESDPSFLYAEFSPSSMILEEGLTHLALTLHYPDGEYPRQAWNTFARIEKLEAKFLIPERIRLEIINHQANTALALKDLDAFCYQLEQGVIGANRLGSEKRRQEAIEVYREARGLWPNESRIKGLADLFF